ncbi:MAG: hypothetical protein HKO81_02515 [Flavobacteriaceae bacterium]|nr:hypothetical protein [Flavobacteriaceae bacterium]
MKKFNYLFTVLIVTLLFTSCLVDDEAPQDGNDQGPLVAGFSDGSATIAGITNDDEYTFDLRVQVKGPSIAEMQGDVALTIGVDASSTAVEGFNFRLDQTSITLTRANNYLGTLPITLLTEGITAPVDVDPVIYLKATSASGDNVVANGSLIRVDIAYLCNSDLAGTYFLTTVRDNGPDAIFPDEEITEVDLGYYKTESIYRWAVGSIAPDQGFNFFDVCNVITVPDQDLAQGFYSNDVYQTLPGSVDPDTGVLIINYAVSFGSGDVTCTGTYVPL